ncbi:MAG TPA: lytic transglycosylase domain-containing protein [Ramlibacter sp.]|nr:lytic transglycosylase domain-containing protein [Ramlibacter sp.]
MCNAIPRALVLLALAAALPAVAGGILVREDPQDGLVLSNEHAPAKPASVPAAPRPVARQPAPSAAAAERARALAPLVRDAARAHGLPEALLQAVVEVESGFRPDAVSPKGAIGLMQLMPGTARALQVRDARDPAANIDGGARYLKELLALHDNDLVLALAAYNAGPGAVQRSGGMPQFAETRRYVPKVIARYHLLQAGQAR